MVRPARGILSPLELVKDHSRYYERMLATGMVHQLYFFSKDKTECDRLMIFGGKVYGQKGGWSWVCGKRKHLFAIYKLLLPLEVRNPNITTFMIWAERYIREHSLEF